MATTEKVRKVLIAILVANIAVAATKLFLGYMVKSNSLVADGYHSMTDGFSNIAGLIGIYMAMRPIDREHPYGHKKFENMTGLFIGVMLFLFSLSVAKDAIYGMSNPVVPQISTVSLIALAATLLVNIFIATYEQKKGKELESDILLADAAHTKSDIFVTIGVLATLLAIKFGAPPIIDPVISIVVVVFIWNAAISVLKRTSAALVDSAAVEVEQIKSITMEFPEVVTVHKIRSRRAGNDIYVDMHIHVDGQMSIEKAHALSHAIEDRLKEELHSDMQVIIHTEPAEK